MTIDTTFLERCINTLEIAYSKWIKIKDESENESIYFDLYRSACVKEFELILEQSGKLLRKTMKQYFASSKEADKLNFKDVFRNAVLRSILDAETCQRWLEYRDNRNSTAQDYGELFANETLVLLPQFIIDAKNMVDVIKSNSNQD